MCYSRLTCKSLQRLQTQLRKRVCRSHYTELLEDCISVLAAVAAQGCQNCHCLLPDVWLAVVHA